MNQTGGIIIFMSVVMRPVLDHNGYQSGGIILLVFLANVLTVIFNDFVKIMDTKQALKK